MQGKVVAAPLCRGSDAEHGNTVPWLQRGAEYCEMATRAIAKNCFRLYRQVVAGGVDPGWFGASPRPHAAEVDAPGYNLANRKLLLASALTSIE